MNKKFLFMLCIILISNFLISCHRDNSNIKLEHKIYYEPKKQDFGDIGYLSYNDIKSNNDEKKIETLGIYSNTTTDMKISWNESEVYDESIDIMKMFQNITLNGNKVKLPMAFKTLGNYFIGFENINLDTVEKDKLPINYKNTSSGYEITLLNKIDSIDGTNAKKYMSSLSDGNKILCRLEIAQIDKKTMVSGITTSIHTPYQSQYELKIDGIGIGNTLNEMYDKFGRPTIISSKDNGEKVIFYIYESIKQKVTYFVIFEYANKSKEYIDIKNNVITDVSVSYSIN